MPEPLFDADSIRDCTFVRHIEIHETLGSTNDRATELARTADIPLPALVVAHRQTAGRGRGVNEWWSGDGALTFSLVLDASTLAIGTDRWPQLSLATAVAVCNALAVELRQYEVASAMPRIKWPNDVLIDGRKVCGILIESPAQPGVRRRCLVVGIGVNVNNSWKTAPAELSARATAICDVTGHPHSLPNVLVQIINATKRQFDRLAANEPELPSEWQQLCWLQGHTISIDAGERKTEGICAGIAADGRCG